MTDQAESVAMTATLKFSKIEELPFSSDHPGFSIETIGGPYVSMASEMRDVLQMLIDKIDGKPMREMELIEGTNNFGLQKTSQ